MTYPHPPGPPPVNHQVQGLAAPQMQQGVFGRPGPGEPFDGAAVPTDLTRPLYGATFGQAIKRFFGNYARFSGRASLSEFWWIELFFLLVALAPASLYAAGIVAASGDSADVSMGFLVPGGLLLLAMWLGFLVPSLAITWRRLHDGNYAGPMYLLALIPYVGAIILMIFLLLPSKPQGRRFDKF